ncbi:dienelactone hydrolase family protein [Roseomonas gilardii]|uniref:Dienelactone hydrolase family protein n=1 Tax=Roseomonas gilardii TaxID=257708 RepID=A0ABU3MHF3_9PROT|nr:dienelactone hydrolase family protein [Roseomonas gilardii]MDT8331886.1 dienelactone hydrolase family protein [Roseomonas gilardii]
MNPFRLRWLALLACLLSGLAASRPAVAAPEPITFPGPDGLPLRALLVLPGDGRPGVPVVALHGCGGLGGPDRPMHLPAREADWAARLAAAGHPVLFPDSFGPRGVAEVCHGGERGIQPENLRREDALAAAVWAERQPWVLPGGVTLLGWSHGGSTVLAAVNRAFGPVPEGLILGAVALYPGCVRTGRALPPFDPASPVLMLLGGADGWTPARFCEALARQAGPVVESVTYPGAEHGFDQPHMPVRELSGMAITPKGDGRVRMGTDAAARADAIRRTEAFLARLSPGAPG